MSKIIKSEVVIKKDLLVLADKINLEYQSVESLDVICFLNGASVFCSDLIRLLQVPSRLQHFGFSSYSDSPLSGEVKIDLDLKESIEGKHVLLLEGLVISGRTPAYLVDLFKSRKPASLNLCAIGLKKEKLEVDLNVGFHMYEFRDEWVEGYGIGGSNMKSVPHLVDVREGI